jgi:single-strand DNA-binding protein
LSLNRCEFIGNLGRDPEVRTTQDGDKVANLNLAVSERWRDKATGESKERTEWVKVNVWGPLAGICEQYLRKGSKVYVAGQLQTRKWQDQTGADRYSTEVVLRGFDAKMLMLDGKPGDGGQDGGAHAQGGGYSAPQAGDMDDEIPF